MASADTPLGGGCPCGAVRFEIAVIFDARYCHCNECRRASGAPATATAVVRREDFRVTTGRLVDAPRANGTDHLCASCRTTVHYTFTASVGELVSVAIGFLDEPERCPPRFHQHFAQRLRWFHVHDQLPKYGDGRIPHPDRRR